MTSLPVGRVLLVGGRNDYKSSGITRACGPGATGPGLSKNSRNAERKKTDQESGNETIKKLLVLKMEKEVGGRG